MFQNGTFPQKIRLSLLFFDSSVVVDYNRHQFHTSIGRFNRSRTKLDPRSLLYII